MLTGAAFMSTAAASRPAAAANGRLVFDVLRDGDSIGSHELRIRREGGRIVTDVDIDLEVKLAFVTLYRYRHRNREVYEDGRLVHMSSRTDNNGEDLAVEVKREGDRLIVDGPAGRVEAPGDLVPTTYWQPRTVLAGRWIDSQSGRIAESRVEALGSETIRYEGRDLACRRYALRGDLDCDLWYGDEGWAKLAFEVSGSRISYQRRPESDVASLPQAVAS